MGEHIAVFGDSISTFEGCVPAANKVYYEGELCERNGVMRPADTWWMQVIDALGGQLWANGAYSGCLVAGDAFPAASSAERAVQVLGTDGMPPDAVLVYVGINDYGEGTPLPAFERAYAAMLANLRAAAPQAELRCATLLPGRSAEHDVEHFRAKYKGESLEAYNAAIRAAVAGAGAGARLVDAAACGEPFDTLDGTHPTKRGMQQLAAAFLAGLEA